MEEHYFISSLPGEAKAILTAVRGHWGTENGLHWRLDVAFR
ncbi:MAG: transposase [Anaerolineae bacterium]|nr:transposase [Anaerolineae bacterium]